MYKNLFVSAMFILAGALLISGCGSEAQAAQSFLPENPSLGPANPPVVAANPSVEAPVAETVRASTEVLFYSEAPEAARMNQSVKNNDLEVQVVDLGLPNLVFPGNGKSVSRGSGNMFLDLGVRVKNMTEADFSLKWSDIYVVNKYQDKFYPTWGGYEQTNTILDPMTIKISQYEVHPDMDPDAHLYLDHNGYLRVIFRLPTDNLYYYFGIGDLPLIEIDYRNH